MARLNEIGQQLLDVWRGWPMGKKVSTLVMFGGGALAFVTLVLWSTATHYSPVMSGLSAEDAAEVTSRLDSERIPYKILAGGAVITVPEQQVHEVRLLLAGAGLPRGGSTGYELFDDPGLGMSRFAERLNFRRSLEGELSRTIRAMDPIKDARVHVVLPEKRLFRDKKDVASASVTVSLRPGRMLSKEQVQAVVHLVSSSVEGLSSDNITLVDTSGHILSRGGGEGQAFDAEMEYQTAVEHALEARVAEILGRVVGRDNITTRITARLDFTHREQTSESYDPDSVATRSERTTDETRTAGSAGPGGIPGTTSNLAGGNTANVVGRTTGGSNKRATTRNYEVSKEVSREANSAPQVARLSVAVLVNHKKVLNPDGPADAPVEYEARSTEEMERLTELVKSAVGFDATRGDKVEVASLLFAPEDVLTTPKIQWWDILNAVWRPVLAVLLFFTVIFVLRRVRMAASDASIFETPKTVRELEAAIRTQHDDGEDESGVLQEAAEPMQLSSGPRPEPAKAATVLKGWLAEG